jgi:signal transduction histidine kinase
MGSNNNPMSNIYNIFDDKPILAFCQEKDRIVYMNEYTKKLFLPANSVLEYIMENLKFKDSFDVLIKYEVFRIVRIKTGDRILALGFKISDLKENESKLRKERRFYERKVEEIVAFSDMVIHDMKNYIFMLDGYLTLLEEEGYRKSYLSEMRKIIENMRILIGRSSLLLKDTEEYMKRERINIKKLLDEAVERVMRQAEEKNITIIRNYKNIYISTDPVVLEAFINVLDNAIKYSPNNSKVEVEVVPERTTIIIRVKDEGPGIPDEYKEEIFRRFRRRSTQHGMGLGLAVTKHLVEMNNGRIWIEDNKPKGAIFNIELPRK